MQGKIMVTIGLDGNKIQYFSDYEGSLSPFEYGQMLGALTACADQMRKNFAAEIPQRMAEEFNAGYENARDNFKPQTNASNVIYTGKVE